MEIVATICARGSSKSVPDKNIRLLCGKPLIVHTIEVAQKCKLINRIIVSTDAPRIAEIARANGAEVPFLRPKALARDDTPKLSVIKHAIQYLASQENFYPEIVVDLDPTSPLRTEKDIEDCIKIVRDEGADNAITVTSARKNPYFNMVEITDGKVKLVKQPPQAVKRRQDAPEVYEMNASRYVWKREALLNNESVFLPSTRVHVMPDWAIDIDSETDFQFVEFILTKERMNKC